MKITIDKAIQICRDMEEKLSRIEYHCGLTGSILYKGESEKDIDIIIYPHNVKNQLPINKIMEDIGFKTNMYPAQGNLAAQQIQPSSTDKIIVVGEYEDIRIDLFFLQ